MVKFYVIKFYTKVCILIQHFDFARHSSELVYPDFFRNSKKDKDAVHRAKVWPGFLLFSRMKSEEIEL